MGSQILNQTADWSDVNAFMLKIIIGLGILLILLGIWIYWSVKKEERDSKIDWK